MPGSCVQVSAETIMKHFLIVFLLAWAAPLAAAQSAFLGVELDPESELGARIVRVQTPSAASLMGLQADDLIVGINEMRLDSSANLMAGMQNFLPGELVTVHVVRGIEELALPGILGRRPEAPKPASEEPTRSPYPFLPKGVLEWNGGPEFVPIWPDGFPESGFPEVFVPGPIWSGERPDWMGKDWGAELKFDWQPQMHFDLLWEDAPQAERVVKLRYPAATPEEEREALIEAAIQKYGADVTVTFEGEGQSISIQTTQRHDSSGQVLPTPPHLPTPPTPPIPPKADPDDEI